MDTVKSGDVFGRLTVVRQCDDKYHKWSCLCQCGNVVNVRKEHLVNGRTRSCKCLLRETTASMATTHGNTKYFTMTPEYKCWKGIIQRCTNPNRNSFARYGGRGITIFQEWRHNFSAFLAYVGQRPTSSHSLDRFPNTDGNYEPGNVRWATRDQQMRNMSRNHLLTIDGRTQCMTDWAAESGVKRKTIFRRIQTGKWTARDAVFTVPMPSRWDTNA